MKQNRYAKTVQDHVISERTVVATAVREAVTLALNEDESDLAIALTLREASLGCIPEYGDALWEFITGPLRNTLQTYANSNDATLVVARLLQILAPQIARVNRPQTNVSGIRSIFKSAPQATRLEFLNSEPGTLFPDDQPTRQLSVDSRTLNCTLRETKRPIATLSASVLMLTDDTQVSLHLSLILGTSIALRTYFDIPLFIQALDSEALAETVVVLDFRSTRMAPAALATLTARLPHDASVVLWGDSAAMEAQLRTLGHVLPQTWVRCSAAVQPEDMSALIRCAITPVIAY